jgi:ABC-type polysaccharide/polyol phosphate transport system ATPase subunit
LAWNIRWLARAYGVKDPDFARTVAKIGAFEDYVNGPLAKAPQSVRPQLGFAVGIAMDFDLYLFDQQAVPQIKEYKDAGLVHLKERTAGKAILVATSLPQMVLDCCEQAFVLERGRLTPFADLKEGVDYFKAMQKADADKQKEAAANKKADDGEGESVSDENEKGVELVQAAIGDII